MRPGRGLVAELAAQSTRGQRVDVVLREVIAQRGAEPDAPGRCEGLRHDREGRGGHPEDAEYLLARLAGLPSASWTSRRVVALAAEMLESS